MKEDYKSRHGHWVSILKWGKPHWYKPEREPACQVISIDEYRRRAEKQQEVDHWIKEKVVSMARYRDWMLAERGTTR